MSRGTSIQWCDDTVNPVMGCDGCELWTAESRRCYAGQLHELRAGHPGYARSFDEPERFPARVEQAARAPALQRTRRPTKPWLDGAPRLVFVSDMGDALSEGIAFSYLEREILVPVSSTAGSRHVWLWLTKQPGRLAEFSGWARERGWGWPPNLWVGTSITSPANSNRVRQLRRVGNETTRRFLSLEPIIADVPMRDVLQDISWVIVGGESGTDAREFDIDWARRARDRCADAGVAFFVKQLGRRPIERGKPLRLRDRHGGEWGEWPTDLRVREVPVF